MRNAAQKLLAPVFWLGVFIAFSSLLWLAIYANTNRAGALSVGALVLLCALVQIAGYLGGRVLKAARIWPAACMLVSAPATLWCAYAGPATLYGEAIDLLDFTGLDAKPPFYYFALPVLVAGVLACVAWVVVGLLFLAADITALLAARGTQAPKPGRRPPLRARAGRPFAASPAALAAEAATDAKEPDKSLGGRSE